MSNPIHNTNVQKIKEEITQLSEILSIGVINSETVLQNKFSYLFKTSPTLFKFIMKNHKQNKEQFNKNIDTMLNLIFKIQTSEITQHDASAIVGQFIGEQYIPQLQ
jgi:hypothetical protein